MTRGKDNNQTIPLQSGPFNHAYTEERNEDFETLVKEDGIAKRNLNRISVAPRCEICL